MLRPQFTDTLKEAMKARDERTLSTVRMIIAALKTKDIDARAKGNMDGIPDEEILSMLQTMVKQRRESIALYQQGNRQDLVDKEQAEIGVIERWLPQAMDEVETAAAIGTVIRDLGAAGMKDMGKVMAELKTRYAGRMDFSKVSAAVKAQLG
ncbi:GatB/YqeY domain-containing protein [Mycobacterium sp. KBS0706]|uniref:GatB/YqeY domain-containing protein n=1 Tax=Mycobacterium sp. KBS0706 TaxID=2578109 RepID=UPI00110FBADA|nr:GatB/YqeY domain-containing protein [Mycobacterium sp. KBS0706]TSD84273.1 GatB/YqeY domain-containing protein [Mycobacterium sp. KBS0706]